MILIDKDPSLKTLLVQEALKARGLYHGDLDNWSGPATEDALEAFQAQIKSEQPVADTIGRYRDISSDGIKLIKEFEGFYPKAYQDVVGVWTIGWGHTGLTHRDGTVYKGRVVTEAEAEALLRRDMDFFEGRVLDLVKVPLNDDQFAALVSFAFNVGDGALKGSTLLRYLNAGDYTNAAEQFLRWDKAGGKVYRGLTRRRKSERLLFLGQRPFIVE